MRRPTFTVAAVLAALPASAGAAGPRAVDYDIAAPGPGAHASGGGFVAKPVRAPGRFNLVGLRWRGGGEPGISLRARREGSGWTPWTTASGELQDAPDLHTGEPHGQGVSNPVWTGQADWVQYRASRPLPGARLHFVNANAGTAGPRARAAQAGQPNIVGRADWGASACKPKSSPEYGSVKAAFVHHTVTANDYTPQESASIVLGICRFHRDSNGWNDIGYNFLVDKYGAIFEGRAGGIDKPVIGAQAQGFNAESTGISNLGTFSTVSQTDAALNSMAALIRWKLPLSGAPTAGTVSLTSKGGSSSRFPAGTGVPVERVSGHRDVDSTECPGNALYAQLPDLRSRVGGLGPLPDAPLTPQRGRTKLSSKVTPGVVAYPGGASVTGKLALANGTAVNGQPVQVQLLGRGGKWKTVARASSGSDGSFSGQVKPLAKTFARVRFPGSGQLRASTSKRVVLKVRPAVAAVRSVAKARVGQTPIISGTVKPAKGRVVIVAQRHAGASNKTVASASVGAKRGRFRKGFRLTKPGLYRFYARFPGDASNVASSSPSFYIRVVRGP